MESSRSKSNVEGKRAKENERPCIHPKSFHHRWSPDREAVSEGQRVAHAACSSRLSSLGVRQGILCAIRKCQPSRFVEQRGQCLDSEGASIGLEERGWTANILRVKPDETGGRARGEDEEVEVVCKVERVAFGSTV